MATGVGEGIGAGTAMGMGAAMGAGTARGVCTLEAGAAGALVDGARELEDDRFLAKFAAGRFGGATAEEEMMAGATDVEAG